MFSVIFCHCLQPLATWRQPYFRERWLPSWRCHCDTLLLRHHHQCLFVNKNYWNCCWKKDSPSQFSQLEINQSTNQKEDLRGQTDGRTDRRCYLKSCRETICDDSARIWPCVRACDGVSLWHWRKLQSTLYLTIVWLNVITAQCCFNLCRHQLINQHHCLSMNDVIIGLSLSLFTHTHTAHTLTVSFSVCCKQNLVHFPVQ